MRDPEVKRQILSERDVPHEAPGSMQNVYGLFRRGAASLYPLSDPIDLEADESRLDRASRQPRRAQSPLEYLYDAMLERRRPQLCCADAGRISPSLAVLEEMLRHPDTVTGLSDAGAHVTLICDATMPTTQLSYWTRDRRTGPTAAARIPRPQQTARNAALYGFTDRGLLQPWASAPIST